jgi:predicted component of type VI protein secretion system
LPQELTGTLGKSRIGENCALGASFQDPTPKLEIQLGPVSAHEHAALDGDAAWWNRANALANAFAPASVSWDYRLLLADADKSLVLGDPLLARLGRSSYLPA